MNRPLRVLIIIDHLGLGGAQRSVVNYCKAHDSSKVELLLCALGKNVEMVPDDLPVRIEVLGFAKWNPLAVLRLRKTLSAFRPDIVYANLTKSLFAAWFLSFFYNGTFVYHERGNGSYQSTREAVGHALLAKFMFFLKKRTFKRMAAIIVNGENVVRSMLASGFSRNLAIKVVENAVDLSQYRFSPEQREQIRARMRSGFGIPPDAPVLINVGRFSSGKNWPAFFETVKGALQISPRIHALAVGDGPILDEMKTLVETMGLSDRIHFTGFRQDVASLLLASDLLVFTSLHEGAPVVVKEAMACGVPVVGYDVGDLSAVLRQGVDGFIVPTGDFNLLKTQVNRILADKTFLRRAGEACKARALETFGIESMALRIETTLREFHVARLEKQPPNSAIQDCQ